MYTCSLCPAFLWETPYVSVQPGREHGKRWLFQAFQHGEITGGKIPPPLLPQIQPQAAACLYTAAPDSGSA